MNTSILLWIDQFEIYEVATHFTVVATHFSVVLFVGGKKKTENKSCATVSTIVNLNLNFLELTNIQPEILLTITLQVSLPCGFSPYSSYLSLLKWFVRNSGRTT